MPGVSSTSALGGVLKGKMSARLAKAKAEPPKFDTGGSLPSGIENGVAKLTGIAFQKIAQGKQNEGKPIVIFSGIIVSPETHAGVPIKGRRTSIIENLFDTPTKSRKTFDDHVEWVMNMFKCLGANLDEMQDLGELETTYGPALVEAGPHFTFRTWSGEKQTTGPYAGKEPRVQESWGQAIEWHEGGEGSGGDDGGSSAGGVEDNTGAADDQGDDDQPADEPADDATGGDDEVDLDALAEAAGTDDGEDAQAKLIEIAVSRGIKKKAAEDAESWEALVAMIKEKDGGTTAETPADDVPPDPAKGDVYDYTPIDPKTKKPMTNPKTKKPLLVECEVKAVDKKTKTATLVNLTTKAEYKAVKWDDLIVK